MTDFDALAHRYVAVFNETDPAARRQRVADLWAPDGTYTDPLADVAGHEAIDGFVAAAQEQLAGLEFRLLGTVDAHHRQARLRWGAGPAGGEPVVIGFDVLVADPDDRLSHVHGFLDLAPTG